MPGFPSAGARWPKPQLGLQQPGWVNGCWAFEGDSGWDTAPYVEAQPAAGFWVPVETAMFDIALAEAASTCGSLRAQAVHHWGPIRCSPSEVLHAFRHQFTSVSS